MTWTPTIGAEVRRVRTDIAPAVGTIIERKEGPLPWVVQWPDGGVAAYSQSEIRPADEKDDPSPFADIIHARSDGGVDIVIDHPIGVLRWQLPGERAQQLRDAIDAKRTP